VRPYLKKSHHKKRAGGVAQGLGPEFKPSYHRGEEKTCFVAKNVIPFGESSMGY
jgi:hypothetical protein